MENDGKMLEEINQKEFPFTSWAVLTWALLWRGLITVIGGVLSGAIIGAILGAILGIVCAITKYPFDSIKTPFQIFCVLLGGGIGFLFLIFQVKWWIKTDFSDFRIAILKKTV